MVRDQAAELIVGLSQTKKKTVRSLAARALEQGWSDAMLKKRLKVVIGLDPKRAAAVENYRKGLLDAGTPPGRAERQTKAYANRLLNHRVALIADQELRMALNNAQRVVWKQMQDINDLSRYAVRVTRIHKDERLCAICRAENGKRRSLQRDLTDGPPFHPRCRCWEELVDEGVVKTDPEAMSDTAEMDEIGKVSSRVYPGLERKKGGPDNWVERAGGLPSYIERIAKHLHYEKGMSIGRAIATAVSQCRRWAAGGENVEADTRAKAAKAIAQWEAKKAKSKVSKLDDSFKYADLIASKGTTDDA